MWAIFQSPVAQLPSIAKFSNAMRTPWSAARRASSPHTSLKRGRLSGRARPHAAGEASDKVRAEQARVVDQDLPAPQRLAVALLVPERVSEHAERADLDVGVTNRLSQLVREARDVLVAEGLPEERLDALEAKRQDRAHIARRVGQRGLDHRADADRAKRISHRNTPSGCYVDGAAGFGALDRPEHHR